MHTLKVYHIRHNILLQIMNKYLYLLNSNKLKKSYGYIHKYNTLRRRNAKFSVRVIFIPFNWP